MKLVIAGLRVAGLWAALSLGLSALTGCAVQTQQLLAAPPIDLPSKVELIDTPFFSQQDHYCGPAALATALNAVGISATPEALIREVFIPARQGSLQIEMLAAARRHGAVAWVIPGSLNALLQELAAGHAVLILQNLGLSWAPSWHYAVVVGYDLPAQEVLLRSGDMPRQAMALRTFEHTWGRAGYWGFVALPPGQLAASADESTTTRALIAFERSAPPPLALKAYAAALQRWPANLTLAMGLGNSHYAAGQLSEAAQVFRDAAQTHKAAAAYHNLAMVLLEQGQCQAAADAAKRALENPSVLEPSARETLARIAGRGTAARQGATHPDCALRR